MNHYQVTSLNPAGHYFDVVLTIPQPDPDGQLLRLPAWLPGSYMIRDFARNIVEISARAGDRELALTQLDKSTWRLPTGNTEVTVSYRVYAWDLSVRGSHLDLTHGFFNGSSLFLEVVGQGESPCRVSINRPVHPACDQWRLATSMPRISGEEFGFGEFEAADYQELIDHPVEMGEFEQFSFEAGGVHHDMVLTGRFDCDIDRLRFDLSRICAAQIGLFGEPAPMQRYLFLVMVVGDGYGGLEHRNSTALMCTRDDLPQPGADKLSDGYRSFLGLCSHEYFHSWNVKRIKPRVLIEPDLSREVYTPLLWAFEGITSYYDDLALLRCGCITIDDYLELLGQTITRVQRGRGRTRQSAAASSFNAWHKFYKQDENAPNAIVSYYAKGCLIALCIDLKMRQLSAGDKSLDDVMRALWRQYLEHGQGVAEHDIQQLICSIVGEDISGFLADLIEGVEELPLTELLATLGIELNYRASAGPEDKGGKTQPDAPSYSLGASLQEADGGLKIVALREDGAAQRAGLSAGDLLIAIDGLRADMKRYKSWIVLADDSRDYEFVYFRRDELLRSGVRVDKASLDTAVLTLSDEPPAAFAAWAGRGSDD